MEVHMFKLYAVQVWRMNEPRNYENIEFARLLRAARKTLRSKAIQAAMHTS